MQFNGVLKKMVSELNNEVSYYLKLKNHFLHLNQLIGKKLSIDFVGYECLACGKDKKIYRQGYCYECFYQQPETADWIMKPELSKAHLGIEERNLVYEEEMQLQPHVVYLAYSSNLKVGVTRKSQIPTRWIDQGAVLAIPFVEVPNRYLAGVAEVAMKSYVSDKTSWQKMLKNEGVENVDLIVEKEKLKDFLPEEIKPYYLENHEVYQINYPYTNSLTKVSSLNLEKQSQYQGVLIGVKGQYLLFEDGIVFNVRSNEGLVVDINICN